MIGLTYQRKIPACHRYSEYNQPRYDAFALGNEFQFDILLESIDELVDEIFLVGDDNHLWMLIYNLPVRPYNTALLKYLQQILIFEMKYFDGNRPIFAHCICG